MDASSEHNIQVGLISAARQLGLPISSKWDEVLHSLAQQENLLIVYDNVLGLELLEKYLPPHGHSAILATSKDLSKEEKLSYPHFSISMPHLSFSILSSTKSSLFTSPGRLQTSPFPSKG